VLRLDEKRAGETPCASHDGNVSHSPRLHVPSTSDECDSLALGWDLMAHSVPMHAAKWDFYDAR
jgi:hypothetical protein